MSTRVTPLGLRLFLEGVEVPVISAQVDIGPDNPATAAIQIVPTDSAFNLLPRTLVHLFFLDPDEVPEAYDKTRVTKVGETTWTENNDNRFEAQDSQYKLLFCGEVIGFNYGRSPSSRQLVLQCMDLSSYWDTCYQWFADYSVGGDGLTDKTHQFIGAGAGMFNSVAGGHQWVIGRILNSKPKNRNYQDATGLLAGVIHLLEAIGGIRYNKDDKGFNGVNDFFTIAELRYNLLGMIGAVEKDTTSAQMFANKAFISWLRNGMTSLGSLLSFRDLINHVCRLIYHNIYPNPCAYYTPQEVSQKEEAYTASTSIYTEQKDVGPILTGLFKELHRRVQVMESYFLTAWQNWPKPPGVDNSSWFGKASNWVSDAVSSAVEGFTTAVEGYATPGSERGSFYLEKALEKGFETGVNYEAQYIHGVNVITPIMKLMPEIVAQVDLLKTDDKKHVQSRVQDIQSSVNKLDREFSTRNRQVTVSREKADKAIGEAETIFLILEDLLGPLKETRRGKKNVTKVRGGHLYNQLILPELFFVSPPRCNVVFPDQYYQFSYSRNFMREVTRLSCQGGLGILVGNGQGAKLLGSHYFAPNITDTRGKLLYSTWDRGATVLLPHEVHSGIIPKFEWVTDGHRWGVKAAETTGSNDVDQQSGRVGYVQRLANYQFYLHRWASRSISVSGVFNPYLVAGFPSVVMDRSMPAPHVVKMIEEQIGRKWLPLQFLGKVAMISHSINQEGAQTSFQLVNCRTHRALDDEFMGSLNREVEEMKTVQSEKIVTPRALIGARASIGAKAGSINIGKNFRIIPDLEEQKELLKKYIEKAGVVEGVRVFANKSIIKKVVKSGETTMSEAELRKLGLHVDSVGSQFATTLQEEETFINEEGEEVVRTVEVDGIRLPEKLTFTLSSLVGTGRYQRVKRKIEEAIRPGWYSDVWGNDRIGKDVYTPLLGTDAITDNISIAANQVDKIIDRAVRDEAVVAASEVSKESQEELITYAEAVEGPGGEKAALEVLPGSVEEAVDSLSVLYGLIKNRGGDIHSFISQYTRRPIANLTDILGSPGFTIKEDGTTGSDTPDQAVIEGFHSRAYGPYNVDVKFPPCEGGSKEPVPGKLALHGLFDGVPANQAGSVKRPSILDRGKGEFTLRPELDPRGRAWSRVMAYMQELNFSRGLLG